MNPTRVAFIAHCYHESTARHKLAILARNSDFRLITSRSFPYPYGTFEIDYNFNPGVRIDSFPMYFLSQKPTSTRWILASRDLGFKKFQPEIIHIENEQHSWIVCQALLYRRIYSPRAKVVVFTWDNLGAEDTSMKARTLERLASRNRRSIDFFICGNKAGKEILEGRGIPAEKVDVVPQFGVDSRMFYQLPLNSSASIRQTFDLASDEFVIGFVGRFVQEKGVLDLIEAVGQLKTRAKRTSALVFVGQGPLEDQIRQRCAQLNVKLRILPSRKNEKIAEVMNTFDVLVLPSQSRPHWKEQFGRVLTEAMACGVPVIGSDSGEIPNVIGDAGLVFREGDIEGLSHCLSTYCNDESRRKAFSDCGRARVLNLFTNERIAERTMAIYDRIIR